MLHTAQVRQEEGLPHSGQWYCYDDTSVEPWDIANLERDCFGGRTYVPGSDMYSSPLQAGPPVCMLCMAVRLLPPRLAASTRAWINLEEAGRPQAPTQADAVQHPGSISSERLSSCRPNSQLLPWSVIPLMWQHVSLNHVIPLTTAWR